MQKIFLCRTIQFKYRKFMCFVAMLFTMLAVASVQPAQAQDMAAKKISLKLNNATIKEAFASIQQQGGFKFVYGPDINKYNTVKITLNGSYTVKQAIDEVLKNTNLRYTQRGSSVMVDEKPKSSTSALRQDQTKARQNGRISGKVLDDRGESLIGASIKVLGNDAHATQSATDGTYSVSVKPGTYIIEVSYISFQTQRITDIAVKENQNTPLNIAMEAETNTLEQVVVSSGYKKASVAGLYAEQKNRASISDGISAEQIALTPDNNVAQVLGRVSGLNVQENKYVTVRGLSDRYNNVTLNGSQLPSTEPNKRNFAFDIIPSSIIDNVVVHKTATANLTGEFSGGVVDVQTRSIPVESFFRIKLGTGINTKATGRDFYQPQRGKYDFFAFDDNRKFSKGFNGSEYDRLYYNNTPDDDSRRNELLQKFPNRFKMYNYGGKPIQDYDISGGHVVNFKNNKRFGVVGGITYRNQQTATEYLDQLEKNEFFKYEGTEYEFITNWSALLNAGYSFGKNKVALKNIYSRRLAEQSYLFGGKDMYDGSFVKGVSNTPLINAIFQSRLEGEHKLGNKGLLVKWHGSIAHTQRVEPDNKTHLGYSRDSIVYRYVWIQDALQFSSNYFSSFAEDRYTWAVEADMPLQLLGRKQLIKAGYQGSYRQADFTAQQYAIKGNITNYEGLPYYEAFAPENFHVGTGGLIYAPYIGNPNAAGNTNGYQGFQRLNMGYLMIDGQLLQSLRMVAGIRMEQNVTANRSSQVTYAGGSPSLTDSVVNISKVDWLPSATLIYAITPKINIRGSYFGSVARPDLRELSFFLYYDAPKRTYINGRDLKPTQIHNTDLRFEYYPSAGEIVSLSGFYKRFINPIELQLRSLSGQAEKTAEMYYQNLEEASNLGFEINFRKSFGFINSSSSIWKDLFLSGNFTWMHSKLKLAGKDIFREEEDGTILITLADQSRPLWGQAPYLINGGLLYVGQKLGLSLSYTRVGERIIFGSQEARYNEWEKARDVLDAQLSYKFLKNNKAEIKLNFVDLLNQPMIRYFNGFTEAVSEPDADGVKYKTNTINKRTYNKGEDELRRRYNYGRNITMTIAYSF